MYSIYTSLYNLNGFIDWKPALDNFTSFADQVVVSTFDYNLEDIEILEGYSKTNPIKIVKVNTTLDNPLFDGELKNAALKGCDEEFCILLDGDERIRQKDKDEWKKTALFLRELNGIDAFFVPVIDLFNTEREFRSLGQKWYIHKNLPNLNRGAVNFAKRANGTIDISRSDSCELIYNDSTLCRTMSLVNNLTIKEIDNLGIKIFHLGWLDKEKRLASNLFWQPVWNARNGGYVNNIIHSKEELDRIEYYPHKLKLWYE